MNPAIYIPIIVLWMIIFMSWRNKKKAAAIRKMIEKRKNGGEKNEENSSKCRHRYSIPVQLRT